MFAIDDDSAMMNDDEISESRLFNVQRATSTRQDEIRHGGVPTS